MAGGTGTGTGAAAPPVATAPNVVKISIGGEEFEVLDDQHLINTDAIIVEPTLTKTDRLNLPAEKWVVVKTKMEQGTKNKYSEVPVGAMDLSTLENTYELVQQNKVVLDHLREWDMDDVFTKLVTSTRVENGVNIGDSENIFEQWPNLSLEEVRKGCRWWNQRTTNTILPFIRQNMTMSHTYLLNCCEEDLRKQLTDLIAEIPVSDRGGPLTFYLLMH